jgi:alkylation response protein AidB-like acyl-CoA dehydrogenase
VSRMTTTDWLTRARSLAPLIQTEALRADRPAHLSDAVATALAETELLWAFVPDEVGGGGVDLLTALALIEEVSRADGATGWVYFVHMSTTGIAAALLGDQAIDAMFGQGTRPVVSGVLAPLGTATAHDSGHTFSGHYSFGSGIEHANWVVSGAVVTVDGRPQRRADGSLDHLALFTPRDRVELDGNWDVIGLQATGSLDYTAPEQFVGEDFSFAVPDAPPRRGVDVFRVGNRAISAGGHAAVALGIGKRALEEVAVAALVRRGQATVVIADQQMFRHDFAVHDAAVRSARAYVWEVFGEAAAAAEAGRAQTDEQYQRLRQACTYAHQVVGEAVAFAYRWAGSAALRRPSAIGNCLTDVAGAIQHKYVEPNTLTDAGTVLISKASERAVGSALDPPARADDHSAVRSG